MTATAIATLYLALACMTVDPLPGVPTPAEANSVQPKTTPPDRSDIVVICRQLNMLQDYFPSINPK